MSYDMHSLGYLLQGNGQSLQVGHLSPLGHVENNNTPELGEDPLLPLVAHNSLLGHFGGGPNQFVSNTQITSGLLTNEDYAMELQPQEDQSDGLRVSELVSGESCSPDQDRVVEADKYMDFQYPRVPII